MPDSHIGKIHRLHALYVTLGEREGFGEPFESLGLTGTKSFVLASCVPLCMFVRFCGKQAIVLFIRRTCVDCCIPFESILLRVCSADSAIGRPLSMR